MSSLAPTAASPVPPTAFGLTWTRKREVGTSRGPRVIWYGTGPDEALQDYELTPRGPLAQAAGYSWGANGSLMGRSGPLLWETLGQPGPVYDAAVAEHDRAIEAQRVAREASAERQRLHNLEFLASLRGALDTEPWAWHPKQRSEARAVLNRPVATSYDLHCAGHAAAALLDRARVNKKAVLRDCRDYAIREWIGRAAELDVRLAALEACRILSGLDEDHATERNGRGWSGTYSRMGHVLAALPELGVAEATHALAAVYRHRRQLPAALHTRLFGA